ncbi:MAG: HesA/MoeB/ThiF family protein [Clostridia bacterium]|nr:HesA/MoeB/ThiF family protein [Clostridia bacterium]
MLDQNQVLRYSRQLILNEFGYEAQEKLLKSKVLVVGAGGLGSPVLYYLAAAGVGTLGVVDFDVVGISNLQRQVLHFTDDLGRKKVDSAEEKLKKVNPDVKIVKYPCRLNIDNIEEIIGEYDVVIDAVDNFPARFLISDCCYFMKKPLIEGASVGFDGILMTIIPGVTPCYRCLYPMPPQDGVVPTCSDTGIMGMITGTIGSLQALEAIKVITGIGETLSGRILTFDGLGLNFREIKWSKKKNCPLCGENPTVKELVEYEIKCKLKTFE